MQLIGEVSILHEDDVSPLTLVLSEAGYRTITTYTGSSWQVAIYKSR